MSMDFTVVVLVRQRFGDNEGAPLGLEVDAPFVGSSKSFSFTCENVDPTESAVLQCQVQGGRNKQQLLINGSRLAGDLPPAGYATPLPDAPNFLWNFARWSSVTLLIGPGVLRASNMLEVRAGLDGTDDFILDNVVVFYKTKTKAPQVKM